MMEYNPEYVHFEPVNGMIGKWCIAADSVRDIKAVLVADNDFIKRRLIQIENTEAGSSFPFRIVNDNPDEKEETCWKFVYIDPAFQDMMIELLYIGISTTGHLTYSINSNKFKYIYYTTSSIEDAREWITERLRFEDVIKAWEDGAAIQKRESISDTWSDVVTIPIWDFNADYRIKPEEKVLKWTDLDIGNIIRYIPNRNKYMQVQGIDESNDTSEHIFAGRWLSNDDLVDWEKVED